MKRVVIAVALVAILAGAGGAGWWFFLREPPAEDDVAAAEPVPDSLDRQRTLELEPFVVPILREGRVTQHLTLVLRVEFANPEERDHVRALRPRLRDSLLSALHGVLAFRHVHERDDVLPVVRVRLVKAGNDVFGPGRVEAVRVHGFSRRDPGEG